MKGNIKWIVIFAAIVAVSAAVWLMRKNASDGDMVIARITQDGTVIREIDLSGVAEPYEFVIGTSDGGSNRVRVERGRICVTDADCPDRICVNQGYIADASVPIVCLPHKLTIEITGGGSEYDAAAGGR